MNTQNKPYNSVAHSRLFAGIFLALALLTLGALVGVSVFHQFFPKPVSMEECLALAALLFYFTCMAAYLQDKARKDEEVDSNHEKALQRGRKEMGK